MTTTETKKEVIAVHTRGQVPTEKPDCYLFVDQMGRIVANRMVKTECEPFETWSCQYIASEMLISPPYYGTWYVKPLTNYRRHAIVGLAVRSEHEARVF